MTAAVVTEARTRAANARRLEELEIFMMVANSPVAVLCEK